MFYRLKKSVFLLMMFFMIVSCGTMNNPKNLEEVPKEVSSLAHSLRAYERSLPSIPEASNTVPIENEVKSCQEGGEMHFTNDYNQTEVSQNLDNFTINMTSQAKNCKEDGITVNGDMQIKVNFLNNLSTATTTFITDFSVTEKNIEKLLVKKGSFIITISINDYTDIVTKTTDIVLNGSIQKDFEFKTKEFTKNNKTKITNISGRKIIDGKVFIIDESYDHSSSPMVYDAEENLQIGGKQRYKNDENHIIIMEAVVINRIQISVDEDGDGEVDTVETVVSL